MSAQQLSHLPNSTEITKELWPFYLGNYWEEPKTGAMCVKGLCNGFLQHVTEFYRAILDATPSLGGILESTVAYLPMML